MVTLTNIKKENNVIYADYFPESDSFDVGFLEYDVEVKKVKNFKYCQTDEKSYLKSYFKKAIYAVKKMQNRDNLPKEYRFMWY